MDDDYNHNQDEQMPKLKLPNKKKTRCNFQNKHTRSTSGKSSIFFCNSSPMSCASFNGIFSGKTISISTKYDVPK